MNEYISAQILNIVTMVKTFNQSCKMAATKDDGQIDRQEEKQLKKIDNAVNKFIKELEAIK